MALAVLLRLPHLSGSFWLDEAAQALESIRPWHQQLQIVDDFQPPLLHVLVHVALYFNQSEWWLRAVSALLPGIFSIYFLFKIVKKVSGANSAVLATLLLSTSSLHIFYSQELRPYALPTAIVTIGWWLLITQPDTTKKWLAYGLTTTAGLYSSYLFPFALLGQLGWSWLTQPHTRTKLLLTQVVSGISFGFWLPMFWLQLQAGGQVRVELPGWAEVVSVPQLKALPLIAAKFVFGVVNLEMSWWFIATTFALLSVAGLTIFFGKPPKHVVKTSLLHPITWWVVVPILVAWVISFWIPVLQPKRVLFALSGCYWAVALLWQWSQNQTNRVAKLSGWAVVILLLSLNLISTWQYYTQPSLQRENWRDLYYQIAQRYPNNTVALFSYPAPFSPWRWYQLEYDGPGAVETKSTGTLNIKDVPSVSSWLKPITEYHYVVLFEYLSDLTDPERQLRTELEKFGFETVELLDIPVIGVVRVYAKPTTTVS